MGYFLFHLVLIVFLGVPVVAAIAVLFLLIACGYDRLQIRRAQRQGTDASEPRLLLKRNLKRLLIAFIVCACSWGLLIVLSSRMLANM